MYCIDELLLNWQYEHRDHQQATKRNLTPRICIYFKTSTWKLLVNPRRPLSTHVTTGRTEAKTFLASFLYSMKRCIMGYMKFPPLPVTWTWFIYPELNILMCAFSSLLNVHCIYKTVVTKRSLHTLSRWSAYTCHTYMGIKTGKLL